MDPNGPQWSPMDPNGPQWIPMDLDGCQRFPTGPNGRRGGYYGMAARPALLVVVLHGDAEAVLSAAFDLPRQLGSAGLTLPEAFRVLPG